MKKLCLILILTLLGIFAMTACTDKQKQEARDPALPSAIASEGKNESGEKDSGEINAIPHTESGNGQAAPSDHAQDTEEEGGLEIVEDYSVEVDGSVGFVGN